MQTFDFAVSHFSCDSKRVFDYFISWNQNRFTFFLFNDSIWNSKNILIVSLGPAVWDPKRIFNVPVYPLSVIQRELLIVPSVEIKIDLLFILFNDYILNSKKYSWLFL